MKSLFIIPYYGKLPYYFPAWLTTAKAQRNIDFLFITDLFSEESDNIKVLNWSFDKLKNFIQSKFDFIISLERPYKFCDYKPAYGYIFEDYLEGYDFWGHCDIDTVFGDLYKYLEEPLKKYDAIGRWGHLSLYKNVPEINRLFMSDKGFFHYKEAFQNDYSYCFDETPGMKMIISKTEGINYFFELDKMVDASRKYKKSLIGEHNFNNQPNQIFYYENGKLFKCYYNNAQKIEKEEVMYLHFQKKQPKISSELGESFYVFYNEFVPRISEEQDSQMIDKMSKYQSPIYKLYEKITYTSRWFSNLLKMNKEQRKINNQKRNLAI